MGSYLNTTGKILVVSALIDTIANRGVNPVLKLLAACTLAAIFAAVCFLAYLAWSYRWAIGAVVVAFVLLGLIGRRS